MFLWHNSPGGQMQKKDIKILIVDDQPGMLETFTDILEDRGFFVEVAEDGFQAIDKVKKTNYDIIFMDIRMPGINGVQTFREVKKINPKVAVIMMTAYAVEDLIKDAIIEGAYTVVYKPFDMERIISTIERVLTKMLILVKTRSIDWKRKRLNSSHSQKSYT